jgi:hypothetical protein
MFRHCWGVMPPCAPSVSPKGSRPCTHPRDAEGDVTPANPSDSLWPSKGAATLELALREAGGFHEARANSLAPMFFAVYAGTLENSVGTPGGASGRSGIAVPSLRRRSSGWRAKVAYLEGDKLARGTSQPGPRLGPSSGNRPMRARRRHVNIPPSLQPDGIFA